jgi:hypothetical protein
MPCSASVTANDVGVLRAVGVRGFADTPVVAELIGVSEAEAATDGTAPRPRARPLAELGTMSLWFNRYVSRLRAALDRLRAGALDALTKPLSGSYHDVWMELHQDLLLALGRTRSAADGH